MAEPIFDGGKLQSNVASTQCMYFIHHIQNAPMSQCKMHPSYTGYVNQITFPKRIPADGFAEFEE